MREGNSGGQGSKGGRRQLQGGHQLVTSLAVVAAVTCNTLVHDRQCRCAEHRGLQTGQCQSTSQP
jgi:hypothetical protein